MSAETIIIQAPCNDCGRPTKHEVLKTHVKKMCDDEDGIEWFKTTYRMIECMGCSFISLERTSTSFMDQQHEVPKREYFPPPISRREPSWYGELLMNVPVKLELADLLDEIYSCQ